MTRISLPTDGVPDSLVVQRMAFRTTAQVGVVNCVGSEVGGAVSVTILEGNRISHYTAAELEDLAATKRAAEFHLPHAKLRKLAKKYRPPQSWYDEENKSH